MKSVTDEFPNVHVKCKKNAHTKKAFTGLLEEKAERESKSATGS